MLFNQLARDPQSQPGACVLLGGEERFKDAFHVLGANATAGVCHGDAHAARSGIARADGGANANANGISLSTGIQAIGKQVGKHLAEFAGISESLLLGFYIHMQTDAGGGGARGVEVENFTGHDIGTKSYRPRRSRDKSPGIGG